MPWFFLRSSAVPIHPSRVEEGVGLLPTVRPPRIRALSDICAGGEASDSVRLQRKHRQLQRAGRWLEREPVAMARMRPLQSERQDGPAM